ncbi:MAG: transcriptional repressor [Candidatus Eremiobacteraeota bacterium]|nr:transcriptional repressor [Candidatus Eremiobacteraeota bacterium]
MSPPEPADVTTALQRLSSAGHRMTRQRALIVREFARRKEYTTAKALHVRLRRRARGIGLATVYRALEAMREHGLVTVAQAGGEAAYLLCVASHHHHAVCTSCGRVDDVPCRARPGLQRMLARLRFRLTEHQMQFFGVCARCS